MGEQIYFEDISAGYEIPTVVREKVLLYDNVRFAGAIDNYVAYFYDEAFAKDIGMTGVWVASPQLGAYMISAITKWIGEWGTLKKLSIRNTMPTYVGDAIIFKGKVTKKYIEEGENYVDLDVSLENQRGEVTNPGKAVVTLPSRPSK